MRVKRNHWDSTTTSHLLTRAFWAGGLLFLVFAISSIATMGCGLTQPMHVDKGMTCDNCHIDRALDLVSHKALSVDCSLCHTKTHWAPSIPHANSTLTGKHTTLLCEQCHTKKPPEKVSQACYTCHKPDYEKAKTPDHVGLNYSKTCTACHSQNAWKPAALDHDKFFKLEGKHKNTACTSCHINDKYKGTPRTCYGCHQPDYEKVKNPDHVASNYSKECSTCHSQDAWKPANFDHDKFFKLEGKHKTTSCTSCHVNNKYKGTPKDCYSCHKASYESAKNPDHVAVGFSKDCATCHNSNAWKPATFDHERFFPIRRGDHSRYQNQCSACHKNTNSYKDFTCTNCHDGEHTKSKMDREHQGEVNGYVYESKACKNCHPQGRSD